MKLSYYTRIFLLITLLAATACPAAAERLATPFRVITVHDGDTVSIRAKSFAGIPLKAERVRLIGIDAPELDQEPWGRRAKRHLKQLISKSNWIVLIERDVEQRDRHGRPLVYLWDRRGERMLNEEMIEAGYARLYTIPPNVKYSGRLAEAQRRAFLRRAGIWSKEGLKESPGQWRRAHPRGNGG
ncbi:MAG: thermonuclease family protein [Nitrospirota bacterium]